MTENTTTIETKEYPSSPDSQAAAGSPILELIHVGVLLQFQSVLVPYAYALAAVVEGKPLVVAAEQGPAGNPTFLVTYYSYNRKFNAAKISLRSDAAAKGFWAPGRSFEKFENPLVIDSSRPEEFVFTDTGQGISIQNVVGPQPYYQVVTRGVYHLAYGFRDTGGKAGLFNISIVG